MARSHGTGVIFHGAELLDGSNRLRGNPTHRRHHHHHHNHHLLHPLREIRAYGAGGSKSLEWKGRFSEARALAGYFW